MHRRIREVLRIHIWAMKYWSVQINHGQLFSIIFEVFTGIYSLHIELTRGYHHNYSFATNKTFLFMIFYAESIDVVKIYYLAIFWRFFLLGGSSCNYLAQFSNRKFYIQFRKLAKFTIKPRHYSTVTKVHIASKKLMPHTDATESVLQACNFTVYCR